MTYALKTVIISSESIAIEFIEQILVELKVDVQKVNQDNYSSFSKSITSLIEECDFVTAIITEDSKKNNSVYYEIGYANGIKKPIILISKNKANIPYNTPGILTVLVDDNNYDGVRFSLEQFIKNTSLKINKNTYKKKQKRLIKNENKKNNIEFRNSLINLREFKNTRFLFEDVLYDMFNSLNFDAVVRSKTNNTEIDFALWVNELENEVGNPIIIEAKYGRLTESNIKRTINQVKSYLTQINANIGLIIYLDKDGKEMNYDISDSNVFLIEATDLANRLESELFSDILLDLKSKSLGQKGGL